MSFHSTSLKHPVLQREFSGTATATADIAPITYDDEYVANGVWVKNDDEDSGVTVLAPGEDAGFVLGPNTSRFFPTDNANRILIQRSGASNVNVSYWGG
jgi:hypothetical protein